MKEYVLGFLFDPSGDTVALIRKLRPEWQKGKLNGIGGKIELGEAPISAMIREFKEETGVKIKNWEEFLIISSKNDYIMYCFKAFDEEVYDVKTIEDEEISLHNIFNIPYDSSQLFNLNWIIPMALENNIKANIEYIK